MNTDEKIKAMDKEVKRVIKELQICLKKEHLICDNGPYYLEDAIKLLRKLNREYLRVPINIVIDADEFTELDEGDYD